MAGHSKWKQIKHKKAIADNKRGKAFTKLIKEITVAARMGGGDPTGNARLRFLLDKAKDINMPLDNAQRAVKRGTGEIPGMAYESYTYEGYGPGNIAVMVDVLTENKNRAIADMRTVFNKNGGILAESGAISWMFKRLGVIEVPAVGLTEDKILELLLDYNIVDISEEEDTFYIKLSIADLEPAKQTLINNKIKVEEAEIEWVPQNHTSVEGENEEKAVNFLSALEDLDDVQNVYTNME